MKNVFLFCIAFLSGLTIQAQNIDFFTSDYIALTVPEHYDGTMTYVNDSFSQELRHVADVPNDNRLLRSLPNSVSNVTVYEVTSGGELKFSGMAISNKDHLYQVIYDFSQTQTISWDHEGTYFSALVGVGVRMVAKVQTKKKGINLSNPFSLVANSDKVEGSLEVRVTGISSRKINELIPTTTDLSPSSISVALQAVATIKSHIYDSETIITPQYLAYNKKDKSLLKEAIVNEDMGKGKKGK